MKKYKIGLYIALIITIVAGGLIFEYSFYRQIPDVIYLKSDTMEEFEFSLPITATIKEDEKAVETFGSMNEALAHRQGYINRIEAPAHKDYIWDLKLFGVIPLKEVKLEVVKNRYVYPIGYPVGIYVKSNGVLVAGLGDVETMDHKSVCPCNHILQAGDYILSINGQDVNLKGEVIDRVHNCSGESIMVMIRRNGELSQVEVKPVQNEEGIYQIGAWIRDSAQGIGTLTYVDESGGFGALGHGINDVDTTKLLEIDYGGLYETEIVSVKKGTSGEPGELSGVIRFIDSAKIGAVKNNTKNGIYGTTLSDETVMDYSGIDPYPVALKQEIHTGSAQVAFVSENGWNLYDIEITDIDYSQSEGNRGLVIQVKDEELLKKTGGIIQGMSGSPILQDGKFVGAVTHVFVNDPTKGYGIFAETMLKQV